MKLTMKLLVLFFGVLLANVTYAESPHEQLRQMVEQLQKSPNNNALREKIIKLARTIKPAPAVPDAAVEFEGRAQFAFKNAQSNDDFLAAAREYEKAVADAPWVSGYYSDLCIIYEKAGKFEEAKRNCEFSMIGLTDAAQITDIKRRIAGLKYGIEQKAKKNIEGFWKYTSLRELYRQGQNADGNWRDVDPLSDYGRRYPIVYEIRKSGSTYEVVGIRSNYITLKTLNANDDTIQFIETAGRHNIFHYTCHLDGDDLFCSIEVVRDQNETIVRQEMWFRKQARCERLGPDEDMGLPIKCR